MNGIQVDEGRLSIAGTWRDASTGGRTDIVDPPSLG